jgi:hypothetical protein
MTPGDKFRMGMGMNVNAGAEAVIGVDYNFATKTISRQVTLGASLRNIFPSNIIWLHSPTGYREPFSFSQTYGISYYDKSGDLFANWTLAFALEKTDKLTYHGGIEAELWNIVALRAGMSNETPTLGAGVHYKNCFMDYAFRFDDLAWSMLRITMGVRF